MHRREALKLFIGAGGVVAMFGCTSDEQAGDSSAATSVAGANPTPSPDSDLSLHLWAEPSTAEIVPGIVTDVLAYGGVVLNGDPDALTASGSYLGPTINVRTGQRLHVMFENRLDEDSIVHWHGLDVPQDQDGQPDDVVGPGETYTYDFVVDNAPGTYWYRPHPHGRTGSQVYRGLAGLLIVRGDEPLSAGDNDLAIVLQDRTIGGDGALRYVTDMHDQMAGFLGLDLVANGEVGHTIDVRPEAYRVRLLNGSNSRTGYLTWSTQDPITVVAVDGVLLPEAVDVPGLVLTPAQRTDLWVDFSGFGPGESVELRLANTFVESGMGMGGGMGMVSSTDTTLALDGEVAVTFVVADGDPTPGTRPTSLSEIPSIIEQAVNPDSPKVFELSTFRAAHWINDAQWEGRTATELETVKAGSVERWEFVNRSPLPHPMHLHGRHFEVVSRTWDDDTAATSWGQIEAGIIDAGRRDTVLVWPGQRVQIAVPFGEHLGYFMYHCHILEHEDAGMMRNFHVT